MSTAAPVDLAYHCPTPSSVANCAACRPWCWTTNVYRMWLSMPQQWSPAVKGVVVCRAYVEKYGRLRKERFEWNRRRAALGEYRNLVVGVAPAAQTQHCVSRHTLRAHLHQQLRVQFVTPCMCGRGTHEEDAYDIHAEHTRINVSPCRAAQVDDRVDLRLQLPWHEREPDWTNEQIFNLITLDGTAAMPADITVTVSCFLCTVSVHPQDTKGALWHWLCSSAELRVAIAQLCTCMWQTLAHVCVWGAGARPPGAGRHAGAGRAVPGVHRGVPAADGAPHGAPAHAGAAVPRQLSSAAQDTPIVWLLCT